MTTIRTWCVRAWLLMLRVLMLHHPEAAPDRHAECLARIAELERELFPLHVMSPAEFDREVQRITQPQQITGDLDLSDEATARAYAFQIWRRNPSSGNPQ